MDLRSSTTTDAFQHLKASPVITKSVFKLKMGGVIFQCLAKNCKTYAL